MELNRAAIARAGILGNLQYNDNVQSWLIELGQKTAVYELSRPEAALSSEIEVQLAQTKSEARTANNQILTEHGIPFTLPVDLNLPGGEAIPVSMLLKQVKLLWGASHMALVLIAQCSYIVHLEPSFSADSPALSDVLRNFARGRLYDVRQEAPEVELATDALWDILCSQLPQALTIRGIRLLLMELSKPLVILVVSADARDATRIRVAEERRELHQALRNTRFRDSFMIHDVPSCRIRDTTNALDDYNPDILLFSGHGNSEGLCFEDNSGRVSIVRMADFATLLGHQENLKLAILNACYSRDQAQCIADAIGYVIGMEGSIRDSDAINFSREFFTALGFGRTFEASFKRARDAVGLDSSSTLETHFLKAQHGRPLAQQPTTIPPSITLHIPQVKLSGMAFWYYFTAGLAMLCASLFCTYMAGL